MKQRTYDLDLDEKSIFDDAVKLENDCTTRSTFTIEEEEPISDNDPLSNLRKRRRTMDIFNDLSESDNDLFYEQTVENTD